MACAVYAAAYLDRGWIPHDEGTIALAAERLLSGELPHRDYDEPYTGALTGIHALAFRGLGMRLISLRLVLAAGYLLFVVTVFAIALRLVPPNAAFLLALAAAAWSVPNYFASLPSWYNLFLAAFAGYALLRHTETARRRWLFAAGLAVGFSIALKVVGLYVVPAVMLFLAFREQEISAGGGRTPIRQRLLLLAMLALAGLSLLTVMAVFFIRTPFATRRAVHFVLPSAALVIFLFVSEWRRGGGRSVDRLRALAREAWSFSAGVLLPLAFLVLPYALSGSLGALWRGIAVIPARQIQTAVTPLPGLEWLGLAAALGLFLVFPPRAGLVRWAAAAFAALMAALLLATGSPGPYRIVWSVVRGAGAVVPVAAAVALLRQPGLATQRRQALYLLSCLFAFAALVQFPFSAPIYFCYAAPLLLLAAAAFPLPPRSLARVAAACFLGFLVLFATIRMHPGYVFALGRFPGVYEADGGLRGGRGGLRVPRADAVLYGDLIAALESAPKGWIWAGPDSPEVYFLSGRRNPTRHFFEHVSDDYGDDAALLRLLDQRRIQTVVVHREPQFSAPPSERLLRELARRYPHRMDLGRFLLLSGVPLGRSPIIPAP